MAMWRSIIAVALLFVANSARSTDLGDLWWNPDENGWGLNVVHQENILFLTFFIYGTDGKPYWLSGSSVQYQGTSASGALVYTGSLAETNGPWFASASFTSPPVSNRIVGTVTFAAQGVNAATLTYNVGNNTVVKQLERLTFKANPNINGRYFGGVVSDVTACAAPAGNGHVEGQALVSISGTGTTQVTIERATGTCTLTGPYGQEGRMGHVQGSTSCTTGANGGVDVFEMEANVSGVTARFVAHYNNGCTETGHFAGVRR